MKNIRNVILMFEGKKSRVVKNVEREMKNAARAENFEEAEKLKRKLFALRHIRDVAVLKAGAQLRHSEESRDEATCLPAGRSHTAKQGVRSFATAQDDNLAVIFGR